MSDIFISYAREDGDFARRLNEALKANDRTTSIDVLDILPTEEWPNRIEQLIAEADSFAFIISPDSVVSAACQLELQTALKFNKRLIPLVCRDIEDADTPTEIATINWLFLRPPDDFKAGMTALNQIFDTEPEWVREHTRITMRAREWETRQHDGSALLRGASLQSAQSWLAQSPGKEPTPSQLQSIFIAASSRAEKSRQRWTIIVLSAFSLIVAGLAVWAELNRRDAVVQARVARSQELLAHAHSAPATLPQRKVLLALEAARELEGLSVDDSSIKNTLRDYMGPVDSRVLFGHKESVEQLAFSTGSNWLASADRSGAIVLWRLSDNTLDRVELLDLGMEATALVFSPDDAWLAAGFRDGQLKLWQTRDLAALPVTLHEHDSDITALSLTSNGKLLLAGSRDGKISVWGLDRIGAQTTHLATLAKHKTPVTALAISSDDRLLASVGESGAGLVWHLKDLTAPRQFADPGGHALSAVDFEPDSSTPSVLSGGRGRSVMIRPFQNEEAAKVIGEHADSITAARYSPDGRWIATSSLDGRVHLWDAQKSKERSKPVVLAGHTDWVTGLRFSPNSELLATYGFDGTVRIWDLNNLADPPLILSGHEYPVIDAEFSPESRTIVTASRDGTLRLWAIDSASAGGDETLADLSKRACRFLSRNLHADEWELYFGKVTPWRRSCEEHPLPDEQQNFLILNHRLMSINGDPVSFTSAANFGLTSEIVPEFLVLHSTVGGTLEGIAKWFDRPEARVSAHAAIGRDGTIIQLVPFDKRAWHAGRGRWGVRRGLNRYSIGVEMVNELMLHSKGGEWYSIFGKKIPAEEVRIKEHKLGGGKRGWHNYTDVQIDVAKRLGKLLVRYYGLRDTLGHEDLGAERGKLDPGPAFPMAIFREYVLPSRLEGSDHTSIQGGIRTDLQSRDGGAAR